METNFYAAVPPLHRLKDITDLAFYRDVPPDWLIAISDIVNSTRAIEQGRYKEVNAMAVASIAAVLNLSQDMELPFAFGGDGATILIPPHLETAAKHALLAARHMADQQFQLDLRVALIPVHVILNKGYQLRLARMQVSENFNQAIFMGDALSAAENLIKTPAGQAYLLTESGPFEADFSGFECRWNKIPSPHEEVVSLIVMATMPDLVQQVTLYQDVIAQIEKIYGSSEQRHPITVANLQMMTNPQGLKLEAKVKYQDSSWRRLLRMWRYGQMARIAMWLNLQGWGIYKSLLTSTTDHEKFDGKLRMTISGTVAQRQQLQTFLEVKRQQLQLVFGLHTSPYALMTCLVYDYFGKQAHFIDSADGGYALAAKQMKQQTMVMPALHLPEEE